MNERDFQIAVIQAYARGAVVVSRIVREAMTMQVASQPRQSGKLARLRLLGLVESPNGKTITVAAGVR